MRSHARGQLEYWGNFPVNPRKVLGHFLIPPSLIKNQHQNRHTTQRSEELKMQNLCHVNLVVATNATISSSSRLRMQPESDNVHDKDAIAVYCGIAKVGYITKADRWLAKEEWSRHSTLSPVHVWAHSLSPGMRQQWCCSLVCYDADALFDFGDVKNGPVKHDGLRNWNL